MNENNVKVTEVRGNTLTCGKVWRINVAPVRTFYVRWERATPVKADSPTVGPSQEVFSGETDGGHPSLPSTTSLVPLTHKAVPSGHAVITHFTALILITANVNMRIININAQNNAVICNYRVALIFLPYPLPPPFLSSPCLDVIMRSSYFELI